MNIENNPAELERKIIQIIVRSRKPKPVKEIAEEIKKSYDDTLRYLEVIGKVRPIRFTVNTEPGGLLDVQLVTGPHHPRFRKPS